MDKIIHNLISDKAGEIEAETISIRRHLHMYPELSGEEKETSRFVAEKLTSLGLEVQTNVGGYGVVGLLHGGKPGAVIGWRADMDAVAMQEESDMQATPYKSRTDGVMHTCGHDAHTAIALGIAEVLSSVKEHIPGTIKFIFQPYEEGSQGALNMIHDGVLENPKPLAVYGLHQGSLGANQTYMEAGRFCLNYGTTLYGRDEIDIEVKPDPSMNNPSRTGNNMWAVQERLIFMLSRLNRYEIKQSKREAHNYVGFIVKSATNNDETREIHIKASYRYAIQAYHDDIRRELTKIIEEFSQKYNAQVNIESIRSVPPVYNDEEECAEAEIILRELIGNNLDVITEEVPPHGTDDYSRFQSETSGLFFFLGSANLERGLKGANHTPTFDIDESCMAFGVRTMSLFLYEILERRK